MIEEYRIVPSQPRIKVSNFGNVRNASTGHAMATYLMRGIKVCFLYCGNVRAPYDVKSLVYEAFTGHLGAVQVRDGNEMNCHLDNLVCRTSGKQHPIRGAFPDRLTFEQATEVVWNGVWRNGNPLKTTRV